MNSVVRAGFSKVDITPPLDWIDAHGIGYWYQRSVRFLGIRDPLFVRTLVIGTGEFRHVVISVDSIFDSYGFVAEASSRIASALGINADNVFITCTHTHSSPLIDRNNTRQGWEYGPFIADRIVQSATEADRNSVNSTVWTSAKPMENVLYNRRPLLLNGRIPELHRPVARDSLADAGPVNNKMTIVKFRDDDGELLGGLCHFGIHGVAVQCSELVSGDCMGRAIQAAERQAGERVVFPHLNGPCGDIDPVLMGDDEALDAMTRRLHAGIEETLKSSERAISTPVPVNALHRIFRAKRRSTRPVAILERERQALLDISDKSSGFRHHSGAGYEAFLLSEEEKVSALPDEFDISYQILQWGPLVFAGVGGEVFTRSGLALQEVRPNASILPVGLTGGAAGYLPTKEMYEQGGYEVTCAQWCPIASGEAEKLFAQIAGDLQKIAGGEDL